MNPSKPETWSSAQNPPAASTAHPDQSRAANPNFGPLPSPKSLPAPPSLGPNAPILPPPTSLFNSPNAAPQHQNRFPPSPYPHPQPLEPRNLAQEQVALPPPSSMSGPPFTLPAVASHTSRYTASESEKDAKPHEPREITAMDEVARRQVELQREPRERAPGDSQVLHQPVALAPSVRTVHGPNGILGGQGPPPLPHVHAGIASSHPLFPISHQQRASGQPPQAMLVPFNPNIQPSAPLNPPPMSSGPMGQGMGQGPMNQGPMSQGQMNQGSMNQGPMNQGQLRESPMNQGSMNRSPMNHASMSQPPMNQSQQNQAQNQHNHVGQNQNQQNQPILNDALSYLDQVKLQFNDQPNVYNRFLDIMKEFKSGIIDTPGVIDRVAQLFTGHPNLIQGFNTFLPPGYRIECGLGDDPNSIRVTTPMGTISGTLQGRPPSNPRSHAAGPAEQHQPPLPPSSQSQSQTLPQPQSQVERQYFDGAVRPSWAAGGPGREHQFNQENRLTQLSLPPPNVAPARGDPREPISTTLAPTESRTLIPNMSLPPQIAPIGAVGGGQAQPGEALPPMIGGNLINGVVAPLPTAPGGAVEKRGPVEFNHAISYVNKIKNRFAQQPDTYKQFLEILQTYQRESRPIGDVYSQVTRLFDTAPDLLEDFKQFLPESAAHANAVQRAREDQYATSSLRSDVTYSAAALAANLTPRSEQPRLPPMGNFAPTPKTSNDVAVKENKRKRGGAAAAAAITDNSVAQYAPGSHVNKRQKQAPAAVRQPVTDTTMAVVPSLIPPVPVPLELSVQATHEDMAMYERVRKIINNKTIFTEFIKVLNFYNQELAEPDWILKKCGMFVNHDSQVMNWLTDLLGGASPPEPIKNEPRALNPRISLARCRAMGPSYRSLPAQERNALCSGRDELCKTVLNDVWASHPTWDSEETGFVAHKKTAYEENLHRIEEERHDYDSNIECLVRTIQLLEPICRALETHPDPRSFKTDVKLGGQSEFIYKRIIYKLYGRADGMDVINMLHVKPYIVAPVLLHRLKDTREKWKAAQRQWYEVWRHQTSANYHRSLDIAGVFNGGDKRWYQPKHIQQEIRVKHEEQRNKAKLPAASAKKRKTDDLLRKDYQYAYRFSNQEVLLDTCRLLLAQLNGRRPSITDSQLLFTRVKELLALFLSIDVNNFRDYIDNWNDAAKVEQSIGRSRGLLQPVLDSKDGELTPATGANTPMGNSGLDDDVATPLVDEHDDSPIKSWFKLQPMRIGQPATPADDSDPGTAQAIDSAAREISPDELIERTEYHMYCNATIYVFFRLFAAVYERLEQLYEHENQVRELVAVQKLRKPAHDLHLIDHSPTENPYFDDISPTANYYRQTVSQLEDYIFVQDVGAQGHIEDLLRRYYLPVGWHMYHLERGLQQMEKNAQNMLMSDKERSSEQLIQLFKKDRVKERASLMEDLSYKKQAFRYLGAKDKDGDASYRITYVVNMKTMHVQLFNKDSPIFDNSTRDHHRRWQQYMTSFASLEPTDGIPDAVMRKRLPVLPAHVSKDDVKPKRKAAAGHGAISSGSSSSGSAALTADEISVAIAMLPGDGTAKLPAVRTGSLGFSVSFESYRLHFQPRTQEGMVSGELVRSSRVLKRITNKRGPAGAAMLANLPLKKAIAKGAAKAGVKTGQADVDKSGDKVEEMAGDKMDVDDGEKIAEKADEVMSDAEVEEGVTPPVGASAPADAAVAVIAPVAGDAVVAGNLTGDNKDTLVGDAPAGGNATTAGSPAATENTPVGGNTTAVGGASVSGDGPTDADAPAVKEVSDRKPSPAAEDVPATGSKAAAESPSATKVAEDAPAAENEAAAKKAAVTGDSAADESAPAGEKDAAGEKAPAGEKETASDSPVATAAEPQVAQAAPVQPNNDGPSASGYDPAHANDEPVMTSARLPEDQGAKEDAKENGEGEQVVAPAAENEKSGVDGEKEADGDVEMGGVD